MSKPNLKYKTRGEKQSPHGKSKVFFTCAKEDFDKYFEKESEDILWSDDNIDCAVWYNKDIDYDFDNDEEKEEYYSLLHDMNLIVIPVTLDFLKGKSRAYKIDFKYAVSNNIPLLMIMEERGLESLFETMCGKIQYLDRFQDTSTQETFKDKLKKFLNDTLISSELTQKIRDSFDAYVFLSYRKKDRKEALEVMKEMHANDFMRDIAIWFDENLVPGENFSDAIKDALEKSSLFTMVVTPSLNESPNYVMEEEYPSALLHNKKILPIMAKDTDKNVLSDNYESLPEVVLIDDKKSISDRLISLLHKEAYKENNNPKHLYYIGLAYLNGIDVEKDTDKGIEILKKSADKAYLPALKKMVDIYSKGKGIKIDYNKAIEYQIKLIVVEERSNTDIIALLADYNSLASFMKYNGNYEEALELSEKVYAKQKEILGENHPDTLSSLNNLAVSYSDMGNYEKALDLLEKVYAKHKESLGEDYPNTLSSLNNLTNLYRDMGNYKKALEFEEKVYAKRKEILGEDHPDTLGSLNNLANLYRDMGNYKKALEFEEKVYAKQKEILGEDHPDTLGSLNNLANLYRDMGNYEKALDLLEKVYAKRKEILGEDHPKTLSSLNNLTNSYSDMGNYKKALELSEKVYAKRKEILGEDHPNTLSSLNNLASSYSDMGNYEKALELFEKVYSKRKEILGENHPDTLSSLNNLAVSYSDMGNYEKALELFEKVYSKRKEILGENHPYTLRSFNNIAYIRQQIGK